MSTQLQTRADFKRAGRNFALEVSTALGGLIAEVAADEPATLTDGYVDGLTRALMERLDAEVASLLATGAPARLVLKFRGAFLREAAQQFREFQLAALPAAGTA